MTSKMFATFCAILLVAGLCRFWQNISNNKINFDALIHSYMVSLTGLPNVESDLSCFTQSALPSGNLPGKITTEDWVDTAELAVCKPSTKWSVV
jgi:hypothetical protein